MHRSVLYRLHCFTWKAFCSWLLGCCDKELGNPLSQNSNASRITQSIIGVFMYLRTRMNAIPIGTWSVADSCKVGSRRLISERWQLHQEVPGHKRRDGAVSHSVSLHDRFKPDRSHTQVTNCIMLIPSMQATNSQLSSKAGQKKRISVSLADPVLYPLASSSDVLDHCISNTSRSFRRSVLFSQEELARIHPIASAVLLVLTALQPQNMTDKRRLSC